VSIVGIGGSLLHVDWHLYLSLGLDVDVDDEEIHAVAETDTPTRTPAAFKLNADRLIGHPSRIEELQPVIG
jgi:hypothetical protein